MGGIQQEIGKHLTQGTGIDGKVFTRTVASLDLDTLRVEPRLVKIDYRAQQPRYVGVLWTYRAAEVDPSPRVRFGKCDVLLPRPAPNNDDPVGVASASIR